MYRHEIESKCLVVYVDHYLDSLFFSFDCTVKCRVACRKQKENVQSSIFTYDKNFLFAFALKTKEVFICNVFLFIRVQQPKKKKENVQQLLYRLLFLSCIHISLHHICHQYTERDFLFSSFVVIADFFFLLSYTGKKVSK